MANDLIRKDDVMNILKSLQDNRRNPCVYAELQVVINNVHELPTVEIIDVNSSVDIPNEVLSVSKPPERYIKERLARGLAEELEKYITVNKYPGMFSDTVFHTHIELASWGVER